MSSHGSYSSSNIKDDYGQGGHRPQYSGAFNESQPAQDGMTTQPSVGRFTEKERANSMFVRKPATPALAPASQSGMSGSGSNNSSGIVNLRGAPLPEGKVSGTEKSFFPPAASIRGSERRAVHVYSFAHHYWLVVLSVQMKKNTTKGKNW